MLAEELKKFIKGDVLNDDSVLNKFSKDASLFQIRPEVVVAPKDVSDIKAVVRFVATHKREQANLSITARSAGTDMTGAPLNDSIVLDCTKYLNELGDVSDLGTIVSEPGVYYRDFEKRTLAKGYILPSYPASKNLCAMGGIINNNAGGEKTLAYGKTENYVTEMRAVLSDGNEYSFRELNKDDLDKKMSQGDFEGKLYRSVFSLLDTNYEVAQKARPAVSKNSVGYNIWDVWDKKRQTFNMIKLLVGSQGTLGITTEAKFSLVKTKPYSRLAVLFLKDINILADLINTVLSFKPTSVESFDDRTLKLSLRFMPGFLKLLGAKNMVSLFSRFIPDLWLVLTSGMPKLVLLVEFEGNTQDVVDKTISELNKKLKTFSGLKIKITKSKEESEKYWAIRRESFNLLRNKILGRKTAPFIDDVIVKPEFMPVFLPELYKILDNYKLLYTIAGHLGNGNFHIIPLMDLSNPEERDKIPNAMKEVFGLVLRYGGSISAEHNDGLIRGHFIKNMFGEEVFNIFREIKNIFDPLNIFNPHKKTDADWDYSSAHIKKE